MAEAGDHPVHDFPYFSRHDLVHVTGGTILETISSNLMMSLSLTQKDWSVLENCLDISIPSGSMVSSALGCTTIRRLFHGISQKKKFTCRKPERKETVLSKKKRF